MSKLLTKKEQASILEKISTSTSADPSVILAVKMLSNIKDSKPKDQKPNKK